MMTAFSFLLGILPLVLATGAGAASRRSIGTTVFGGMLLATIVGVLLIPVLYVTFQWLRERFGSRRGHARTAEAAPPGEAAQTGEGRGGT
jgi:HAE1 family hydrophobic/amphiphilic exporter-1